MAIDYNVVEVTYEDTDELQTALDNEGAQDWELVSTYPSTPDAETGHSALICIFKK